MSSLPPDALRGIAFFAGLSDAAFDALGRQCHRRTFKAREIMITQEDQSGDVLFLLSGHARVNIYSPAGSRVSFRDLRPGAIFGELAAIDGQARSASVECVEPCLAVIMPQKTFARALDDHPAFRAAVLKHLSQQVRSLTARVFEFSTLAVRNRVQAELLRIVSTKPGAREGSIEPAPTHEEIASRISTHREAVTRELSWLEERGLITRRGRILLIRDVARLRRLVEEGSDE